MVANPLEVPSLVLSLLVLAATAFLGVREWLDRRSRGEEEMAPGEEAHLAVRDVRRRAGLILMTIMGVLASIGYWINPAAGREDARRVVAAWVVIGVLMIVMMVLAALDWLHTAQYAQRVREELADERAALIEAIRRRKEGPSKGPPLEK